MKRIVILGSSLAGITAIEKIQEKSREFNFTLISLDGTYPGYRHRFAQAINKEIKQDELYVKDKEWFQKNNIAVITERKVERINFNKKAVFTEDKERIDYDILILCDFPAELWPKIKGTNKHGVYSLNKTKNVLDFCETLPIIESVVIESDRADGFLMALGYLEQKKDVSLVTKKDWLLPSFISKPVSDALINALAEKGLNIYTTNEIIEILGESDAKAVKLKTNKVLASDVTILADTLPDAKFLRNSNIALAERVNVDPDLRTSVKDVYACDVACQRPGENRGLFKNAETLIQEGTLMASQILQEELAEEPAVQPRECNGTEMSVSVYGSSILGSDAKELFDEEALIYKRLTFNRGKPSGAILINAQDKKGFFERIFSAEPDPGQIEAEFVPIACAEEPENAQGQTDIQESQLEQDVEGQGVKDSQSV